MDLPFEFGIVGSLHQDFYLTVDGSSLAGILGGPGAYGGVGARLWSDSVGVFARVGTNFPVSLISELTRGGIRLEGVAHIDNPLDHRRFFAYVSPEQRLQANPAAHYLRTGHPLPKELMDYSPPGEKSVDRQVFRPDAFRPADLRPSESMPVAVHLCPGDYLTHLLLPIRLRERGVRLIALDPASDYIDPGLREELRGIVRGLDAFLPSYEEACEVFRPATPDPWEMAEAFTDMGCRLVVIKRGAAGQCVWDGDARQRWQVPAYPARLRDVTGAGDAFCGGFLVGLARTGDVVEATLMGNVSASLTIEGSGPLFALETLPGLATARLEALRPLVSPV